MRMRGSFPRCPTGVSSAVIPNKSLAESNKSDSPAPSYPRGAPILIDLCSVRVSAQHIHRHRVRRSGRCQPNLARPQLSGEGLERGRSVIYRVFMNDEDFVVVYADSPEEAMLKLRDAGLEPVKAEPFDAHPRRSKGTPAR